MDGSEAVHQHYVGLWRVPWPPFCASEHGASADGMWDGAGQKVCAYSSGDAVWSNCNTGR